MPVRDWRVLSGLFFVTTTLEALAQGQMFAFTPLYLQEFGLTPEEVARFSGLLTAGMMAVAFPLAPLWGALSERYARKPVVVRSQLVETLSYTVLALAPGLPWVVVGRMLYGLAFGNVAVLIATQTLLTPARFLGPAISTVQAAMPIASSIGPPIGAFLLPLVGIRGLLLVNAASCLLAGLLLSLLMPEPSTPRSKVPVLTTARRTLGLVWRRPVLRWNFAAWFLTRGAMMILTVYLPVQIVQLEADPAPVIGFVLGAYGAIMAAATWAGGWLVGCVPPARLFWTSMAVAALAATGVAMAPNVAVLAVCAWLVAVPTALSATTLYTNLAGALAPTERTPVMSLTPFPRNTAMFAFPALGAAVAGFGPGWALGLAAVAYAAAALAGLRLAQVTAREPAPGTREGAPGA